MAIPELRADELQSALKTLIANHMAEGVNVSDQNGILRYTNPAFDRMFGYEPGELIGQHVSVLNAQSQRDSCELVGEIVQALNEVGHWHGEFDNVTKSARRFTTRATISALTLSGETYWISVQEDVTAQKALESQLRQSEKMRAIGQLAAGIAHDFNNVLTIMLANVSLLETRLGEAMQHADVSSPLDEIRAAARRAGAMTKQLLLFSRRGAADTRRISPNEVLAEFQPLVRRLLPKRIEVSFELAADAPDIRANESLLEQLVLNFAVNARDAMPDGGELRIVTSNHDSELRLSIIDDGVGMNAEVIPRIFEPFYTTKLVGEGGLGLSIVYSIVTRLGGRIEVDSEIGRGTRFDLYLPAA